MREREDKGQRGEEVEREERVKEGADRGRRERDRRKDSQTESR